MHVINDRFGFLTGVIQEIQISGVLDIGRHTGGIKEELAFRRRGLVFSLRVGLDRTWQGIIDRLRIGDQSGNGLVDFS